MIMERIALVSNILRGMFNRYVLYGEFLIEMKSIMISSWKGFSYINYIYG